MLSPSTIPTPTTPHRANPKTHLITPRHLSSKQPRPQSLPAVSSLASQEALAPGHIFPPVLGEAGQQRARCHRLLGMASVEEEFPQPGLGGREPARIGHVFGEEGFAIWGRVGGVNVSVWLLGRWGRRGELKG